MNNAVIFLNGDKTDVSRVKNIIDENTLIIGCDGGTKHLLSLGFVPHVVIGDMDSLTKEIKSKLKIEKSNLLPIRQKKTTPTQNWHFCTRLKKDVKKLFLQVF